MTGAATQDTGRTLGPAAGAIAVDFIAVTEDGHPVTDLTAAEVAMRVDNRGRTLQSLQLVRPASEATSDPSDAPPPFGTNAVPNTGRPIVLLIDDESIRPGHERETTDGLVDFLSALNPADRVALVTAPHGGVKVNLTSDRARVRMALSQLSGMALSVESADDAACRTQLVLQSLIAVLETIHSETPVTILLVSAGLAGIDEIRIITSRSNSAANRGCALVSEAFAKVADAVAIARARVYAVRVENSSMRPLLAGLENLAGVTGGALLTLSTAEALTRVARETSAYYVAAFQPAANERRGSSHQLSIRVTRPGVTVRSRRDVLYPAAPRGPSAAVLSPRDILVSANSFRDLPLRVGAHAVRDADKKLIRIVTLVEPGEATPLAAAAVGLIDRSGRLLGHWIVPSGDLLKVPFTGGFVAPPGSYRIRVAAVDPIGRTGAAEYPMTAELVPAGSLRLGSLVLGVVRENSFRPRLQFSDEPVAIVQLDIYGGEAGSRISMAFELSATLNGPTVVSVPASSVTGTSEPDRVQATAAIPIGALTPGDYVVRAIVGLENRPAGRAVRTLRKTR